MDKCFTVLKKSMLAGILIAVGVTVRLLCENTIAGSVLFSVGLFFICFLNMNLYTGKIGFIEKSNASECALTWVGNFIGCIFAMGLIRIAKPELKEAVENTMNQKTSNGIISTAILSFFCGVIMFLVVKNYKTSKSDVSKTAGIILGVTVFLLCGFEHSVANMAYSTLFVDSTADFLMCMKLVLVSSIFNSAGAILARMFLIERRTEDEENSN